MASKFAEINQATTLNDLQLLIKSAKQDPANLPKDFSKVDFSKGNILKLPHLGLASKERFVFEKVNLTDANFTGANLSAVIFKDVNLENANFTNANLHDSVLLNCNIQKAKFHSAMIAPHLFIYTTGYETALFDNQSKMVDAISREIASYKDYVNNLNNNRFIANIYGDQDPVTPAYLETIEAKLNGINNLANKSQEIEITNISTAPTYSTIVPKSTDKQR